MGKIFLDHIGGTRLFSCASCDVNLTNRSELISTRFTGATGRAFLFHKVVNLLYSEVQDRVMLTGRHMVRDVSCKNCNTKLGWVYEFATEENQRTVTTYKPSRKERIPIVKDGSALVDYKVAGVHGLSLTVRYKEGRVILERALVTESDGIEEIQVNNDD